MPNRSSAFPACGVSWAKPSRPRWPSATPRPSPPWPRPGRSSLARDSRPSGQMLAEAIHAGLQAVGRDTIDAGIAATPTTGVLVRHCRAAGGDPDHGQP